jgi:hypothetical protein
MVKAGCCVLDAGPPPAIQGVCRVSVRHVTSLFLQFLRSLRLQRRFCYWGVLLESPLLFRCLLCDLHIRKLKNRRRHVCAVSPGLGRSASLLREISPSLSRLSGSLLWSSDFLVTRLRRAAFALVLAVCRYICPCGGRSRRLESRRCFLDASSFDRRMRFYLTVESHNQPDQVWI